MVCLGLYILGWERGLARRRPARASRVSRAALSDRLHLGEACPRWSGPEHVGLAPIRTRVDQPRTQGDTHRHMCVKCLTKARGGWGRVTAG